MRKFLLFTIILITIYPLSAQEKFLQHDRVNKEISNIDSGDIDKDGDMDFLIEKGVWLENDSNTNLFTYRERLGGTFFSKLADLDNDGDMDVFYKDNKNIYYKQNNGHGSFSSKELFMTLDQDFGLFDEQSLVDIDNDKDIDVLYVQNDKLYLNVNNNDSTFETIDLSISYTSSSEEPLKAFDFNNDKFFDIAVFSVVNDNAKLTIYLNDGSNNFSTTINVFENLTPLNFYNYLFSDYDKDGDIDVIANQSMTLDEYGIFLYKNDGSSRFENINLLNTTINLNVILEFKPFDIDKDEDLDIVFSMKDPDHNYLDKLYWVENNDDSISENVHLLSDLEGGDKIDLINVDNDPDKEIIVLDSRTNTLTAFSYDNGEISNFIIHGTGNKTTDIARYTGFISQKEMDYNTDSYNDYIAATISGIKIYTNTLEGSFVGKHIYRFEKYFPKHEYHSMDFHFKDVDQDGDLDAIYKSEDNEIIFLENIDYKSFSERKIFEVSNRFNSLNQITVGDVDGDNDLDVVFDESGQNARNVVFWLKNTNNTFEHSTLFVASGEVVNIALSDINKDKREDIILGIKTLFDGHSLVWYSNKNANDYVESVIDTKIEANAINPIDTIVVENIDGDEDIDMIMGISGEVRVYENDGLENFVKSDQTYTVPHNVTNPSKSIHLADIDLDNDMDMILNHGRVRVLENSNNSFTQTYSTNFSIYDVSGSYAVIADYDNDLDFDFFVIAGDGINYFENLHAKNELSVDIEKVKEISCNGDGEAIIRANVRGGIPPYTYELLDENQNSIGNGTSNIFAVLPGNYTIKVIDKEANEILSNIIAITEPEKLQSAVVVTGITCKGENNGVLEISTLGGVQPYQYQINEEDRTFSNVFSNLAAGTYQIHTIDANGCITTVSETILEGKECTTVTLPVNNFTIKVEGKSCKNNNDGTIKISTLESYTYTATLVGASVNMSEQFESIADFSSLDAGSYEVCITLEELPEYQKCDTLTITEPEDLSVTYIVNAINKSVVLTLNGGENYSIVLNEKEYNTSESEITLPLQKIDNSLSVKTDKECQGSYEKIITIPDNVFVYPNPSTKSGIVNVRLKDVEEAFIELNIYNLAGESVMKRNEQILNGQINMDVSTLAPGVYMIHIITKKGETFIRKIVKS